MNWLDVTSYYHRDKKRTPLSWKTRIGRFVLSVRKHAQNDRLTATCSVLFDDRELGNRDVEKAKNEAVVILQAILEEALADIKNQK